MEETNEIYGLVLSGGKSTRMGTDKGSITYHNIPQRDYLYQLLEEVCDKVFLSIRPEQEETVLTGGKNLILDRNEYKGPYNGLLSAHREYPGVAWMVLACDLPLIDLKALQQLKANRDKNAWATAFATRESGLPEPLAAIWEPMGLQESVQYLNEGNGTCPRKFLIRSNTTLVFPEEEHVLLNANSQEEYEAAVHKLNTI